MLFEILGGFIVFLAILGGLLKLTATYNHYVGCLAVFGFIACLFGGPILLLFIFSQIVLAG